MKPSNEDLKRALAFVALKSMFAGMAGMFFTWQFVASWWTNDNFAIFPALAAGFFAYYVGKQDRLIRDIKSELEKNE